MNEIITPFNKTNLFPAAIIERYSLCKPGSEKNIEHVVLSLKGSGLTYKVGDSVAVASENDPEIVDRLLSLLHATGAETVTDKHGVETFVLREFLTKKANLADPSKKLVTEIANRQTNPQKKERLDFILSEAQKDALKEYLKSHEIWDTLEENQEVRFELQQLCNLLMPLLPRFYSIASSNAVYPEEVHLTVAELIYETNGHTRRGVCTHYLCKMAPLNQPCVPLYVHPSSGFTLPEDGNAPIIMVGPGTGVAPYRGFLQERLAKGAKGMNWLFFGEWYQDYQFLYEDFWKEHVQAGSLRLETAFSRDQEHKIYVQHRLMQHGQEIYELLNSGAYFYVCGDAHRMAKDVDAALHQIVQEHGKFDEAGGKEFVKKLKAEKRYLRDVY